MDSWLVVLRVALKDTHLVDWLVAQMVEHLVVCLDRLMAARLAEKTAIRSVDWWVVSTARWMVGPLVLHLVAWKVLR